MESVDPVLGHPSAVLLEGRYQAPEVPQKGINQMAYLLELLQGCQHVHNTAQSLPQKYKP